VDSVLDIYAHKYEYTYKHADPLPDPFDHQHSDSLPHSIPCNCNRDPHPIIWQISSLS
jgi:hypothetical protein